MIPFFNRSRGVFCVFASLVTLSGCGKGLLASLSNPLPGSNSTSAFNSGTLSALYCTSAAASNAPKYAGGNGTSSDPYLICTSAQLSTLMQSSADWSSSFLMLQPITAPTGAAPIGNAATPFLGTFDGGSHAISGLSLNNQTSAPLGLFGVAASPAVIKNVILSGAMIINTPPPTMPSSAGGLLGQDNGGTQISNSSVIVDPGNNSGSIYSNSGNVGGIVGTANGTLLSSCASTISIAATASTASAGGLVGIATGAIINKSYASGAITGYIAGGLIGTINSATTVQDSYATGTVTGTNAAGGIIGNIAASSTASGYTRTYASGNVTGAAATGGLLGVDLGTSSLSTNSFYFATTGHPTSAVGTPASGISPTAYGTGIGTSVSSLQSNYTNAGWDFTTPVWVFLNTNPGTFPSLSWQ